MRFAFMDLAEGYVHGFCFRSITHKKPHKSKGRVAVLSFVEDRTGAHAIQASHGKAEFFFAAALLVFLITDAEVQWIKSPSSRFAHESTTFHGEQPRILRKIANPTIPKIQASDARLSSD